MIANRVIQRFSSVSRLEEAREKAHKLVMEAHAVFQNGKTVYRDRMTADAWKDNLAQYERAAKAWDGVARMAERLGPKEPAAVQVEADANRVLKVIRDRHHEAEGLWKQALRDEKFETERPDPDWYR